MILKNNRAPLLSDIKLCALSHCHMWIQTAGPEMTKLGFDLCDLDLWPPTLTFCMDITSVIGYNYWRFYDDGNRVNKAFREWQHPSALDQGTNSPFIGQQVGNCKSFTLTHCLANLFAMHHCPRSIPLCIQHHIQLTSLSLQVSRPSHSWDTAISIFYLEKAT